MALPASDSELPLPQTWPRGTPHSDLQPPPHFLWQEAQGLREEAEGLLGIGLFLSPGPPSFLGFWAQRSGGVVLGLIFTFPTILSWVPLPSSCAAQTAGAGGGEQVSRSAAGLGGVRPTGKPPEGFPQGQAEGQDGAPSCKAFLSLSLGPLLAHPHGGH